MRQPISFAYRNIVFGRDATDAWALYRVQTSSYAGLTTNEKKALLSTIAAFADSVEADFQLLRVTRPWSIDAYAATAEMTLDARHGHPAPWRAYLASHRSALGSGQTARPEVYLSIRLAEVDAPLMSRVGRALEGGFGQFLTAVKSRLSLTDPRALTERRLGELLRGEARAFARAADYLDCDRAASHELQWLVRRAFCRGLGEPELDERFLPQALVFEEEDGEELLYQPLECDMLRLADSPINIETRHLRIESELGESYQAFLTFGALPENALFPGRQAELLFAPLEALDAPVDASFCARYIANDRAMALARRRIIDADNVYVEESHGDHGPSSNSSERPQAARELEAYLSRGARPPLLRASISLAVAAPTRELLEARVDEVRREYGSLRLHRPLGEQLRLFVSHLPAQPAQVP